jgi:hypothetical protein
MIHDQLPEWATSTGKNAQASVCIVFMTWRFLYDFIMFLVFFLFHVSTNTTETDMYI